MTHATLDVDYGMSAGAERGLPSSPSLRRLARVVLGAAALTLAGQTKAAAAARPAAACCSGAQCSHCYWNGCQTCCGDYPSGCGGSGYGWTTCCNGQNVFCHDYYSSCGGGLCVCPVACGYNCPC